MEFPLPPRSEAPRASDPPEFLSLRSVAVVMGEQEGNDAGGLQFQPAERRISLGALTGYETKRGAKNFYVRVVIA
jgi:hypothetical protein